MRYNVALDSRQLEAILGGLVVSKSKRPFHVKKLSCDSREVGKSTLFVALTGDNHDAHHFITAALAKDVAAVLVEQVPAVDVPYIQVKNTRHALARLAQHKMRSFKGKVVALTGSVGKTTNKEMLAAVLAESHRVFATQGNLNNDLGVPFTVFSLPQDSDYAVIEMGANHLGEIAYLADIVKSDVAMITNAGPAHLEGFGGLAGVAMAKSEIFSSLKADGVAVINADDAYAGYWQGRCGQNSFITFSQYDVGADVYAQNINATKTSFELVSAKGVQKINLEQGGEHMIQNALGVSACAIALGVRLKDIASGLAHYKAAKGRYKKQQLGQLTLIDDSYNANPASVVASSALLANESGYKVLVLGDMAELGANAKAIHQQTAEQIKANADAFLCLGPLTASMMGAFGTKGRHYDTQELLNEALLELVRQHDVCTVLVKGSRCMQMEKVIAYLSEKEQARTAKQKEH